MKKIYCNALNYSIDHVDLWLPNQYTITRFDADGVLIDVVNSNFEDCFIAVFDGQSTDDERLFIIIPKGANVNLVRAISPHATGDNLDALLHAVGGRALHYLRHKDYIELTLWQYPITTAHHSDYLIGYSDNSHVGLTDIPITPRLSE